MIGWPYVADRIASVNQMIRAAYNLGVFFTSPNKKEKSLSPAAG
jgi:hypothetical protein